MTYKIRSLVRKDIPQIVQIYRQTDSDDALKIKKTYSQFYAKKNVRKHIRDYVVVDGEKVIAFSGFSKDETGAADVYWLNWTAVSSEYANQGVGKLIVSHVLTKVKALNARKIYVMASSEPKYKKAIALYKSLKFKKEAILKDYYEQDVNCIMLSHTLR